MNFLRREIKTRRILVKPSFQDFDRINVLHVTYEQFTRALTKLGLNMPAICFKILARKYMDKNNSREINYDRFLKDVDYEHVKGDTRGFANRSFVQSQPLGGQAQGHDGNGVGGLPDFRMEQTTGDNSMAYSQGQAGFGGQGAGPDGNATYNVNFDENDRKHQYDEANATLPRPGQPDFRSAGLDTEIAKNKSKLTALGNSKLKTASDIDSLEEKLRAFIVMKKIRIDQFFIDFDKLRKGSITKDRFRRVLKLSGIDVEDYQFELLAQKYQLDNGQNMDWFSFCRNIDAVNTTRGIEKNPLYDVPQLVSDTTLPARRYFLRVQEPERTKLLYILDLVKHEIQTRRVLLKPHFADFDRVHNGYVTRSQFLRVLSKFEIYPQDEYLDVILQCYSDNGNLNEVNYYEFCKDVDGPDEVTTKINTAHASMFLAPLVKSAFKPYVYKDSNEEITEVLARIQKKVKEERIRISEFLRDFDRLRSGGITNSQFRIGMNMAKLPLSNSDFVTITEHFKVHEKAGHMQWNAFCDMVDQVFNVKQLEMNPNREAEVQLSQNMRPRNTMSQAESDLALKVIEKFKFFTTATRLYVKQFFQDWDHLGRNKVSPKQFRQVLATVKFNMTDPEFKAVSQYYLTEDVYVNYLDFIKDTTSDSMGSTGQNGSKLSQSGLNALQTSMPFETAQEQGDQSAPMQANDASARAFKDHLTSTQFPTNYSFMVDLNVDPNKVLEKIKRDVRISRTRLREYLQDFDGLRKGTMTWNKFFGSLDKMKIQLTPNEMKALERIYRDPTDSTKIEYLRFVQDVDLVFTTPGLEKNPLYKVGSYKTPTFLDPKARLSPHELQRLHQILIDIGTHVKINRILIKPFFKDKDKAHSGKIGFDRFRAIMDTCNVPITEEAFTLLCKRFGHQDVEFDYMEFDDILKQYSDLGI